MVLDSNISFSIPIACEFWSTKTKAEQLEWRRSKVVEMRARELSQIEIARELQVSRASISSDIAYMRNEAKESIREYTTEYLPEQYQVCLRHSIEYLSTPSIYLRHQTIIEKSCRQWSYSRIHIW
jgi:predicted transcriptional regulator